MAACRLTPDAVADLDDIWRFIASDNRAAADRVEEAIFAACEALARNPLQGHIRPDLTKLPVRFWTLPSHPNYMVVYRPETSPLQVLRVLHGKRNIRRILNR
ncbi:MAG: type II toxin-antitoxin system RelE/ParE family toxin [Bryobacteraceae bacterium]